jgi:hypothetical protein
MVMTLKGKWGHKITSFIEVRVDLFCRQIVGMSEVDTISASQKEAVQ